MGETLREMADTLDLYTWRRWTLEQHVPDFTEELRDSGVRVLATAAVNSGMLTFFTMRSMVEEFWRLPFDELPKGDVTFFDNTPHYIFFDRPEAFDAAVMRFVAGEEQPAYSYREVVEDVAVEPEVEPDDEP